MAGISGGRGRRSTGSLAVALALALGLGTGTGGCAGRGPSDPPTEIASTPAPDEDADTRPAPSEAEEPAATPTSEPTEPEPVGARPPPPPIADKKHYTALVLGEWWFATDVDRWFTKRGAQLATGRCPIYVAQAEVNVDGGYFHGVHLPAIYEDERRRRPVQFVDLDGSPADAAAWLERTRAYLDAEAPDVVFVMMAGQAPIVGADDEPLEIGAEPWRAEYRRRLIELLELLDPARRRVVWIALPDPASAGDPPPRWRAIREVQAEVAAAWAPTVEYVESTPFLVDAEGELPRLSRVNNQRRLIFDDGAFTSTGAIYIIQRLMSPLLLRALGREVPTGSGC
ncbi:MAG: hypothetical protein H6710_03900 [Myxococcales bacterium]|nr:hypothetical protein [Myxococcales bacterium]